VTSNDTTARGDHPLWLLSILAGALLLRMVLFTGVQGNDDRLYSSSAYQMSRGEKPAGPDLFRTRVGYVAPVAALYHLFGVHPVCLLLPNLAASLALAGLAYRLGRTLYSAPVGRVAGIVVAMLPLDLFYATMGGTDPLLAALIGLGVWLLCDAGTTGSDARRIGCAAGAGLAWGAAHLTKESAFLLLLPVLPLVLLRGERRSVLIAGLAAASVAGVELLLYGVTTGDPLYRVHLARGAVLGPVDLFPGLTGRLGLFGSVCLNPWDPLFAYGGGVFALSAGGAAWALWRDRRRSGALASWWLGGGLILCCFPASLVPYRAALPVQPRMLAALTLPGALLAAVLLVEGVAVRTRRGARIAGALGAILALVCAAQLHQDGLRWRGGLEWARARIAEHPGMPVVTDPRSAETLRMMFGYAPPMPIRGYAATDPPPPERTLLLDLPGHAGASRLQDGVEPPPWWMSAPPPLRVVAEEEAPGRLRLRGGRVPGERRRLSRVGSGN